MCEANVRGMPEESIRHADEVESLTVCANHRIQSSWRNERLPKKWKAFRDYVSLQSREAIESLLSHLRSCGVRASS